MMPTALARLLLALVHAALGSFLFALVPAPAAAQVTGRGSEFWACWPRSHLSLETSAELVIMADVATTAEVDGAFVAGPAPVAPGAPWIVGIPDTLRIGSERVAVPSGFRVRSLDPTRPLVVTLRVPRQSEASDDTARLLPVEELGTSYLVTSYRATLPGEPSFYVVVATEDATSVDMRGGCAAASESVVLDRGEAWQSFCDWRDFSGDVSGAEITSDKPVAVFAGASDAFVPRNYLSGDFIVEQSAPVSSWGQEFLVTPLPKGPGAVPGAHDVVRVMPSDAGTLLVDDGSGQVPFALAGPGIPLDLSPVGALHIQADVPVDVHQYATGVEMTDLGDPFMAQVPALSHWGIGARAWIPAYYSLGNYLSLVTSTAAVASVRVDGVPVASWTPLPGGSHSWALVDAGTLPGERVVSCDEPVSVLVHGYNAEYLPEPGLGRTPGSHGTPAAHAAPPCILVPVLDVPATSCAGSTVPLREAGSSAAGCAEMEYRWLENGVEIPGCGFGPAGACDVLFRSEAVYSLVARCVGNPSCTATASQRVIEQPPPPVVIAPNPVETCAGIPVRLTAGSGFLLYSWTSVPPDPGVTPRTSALPEIDVSPEVPTTYTLAAFDIRGCVAIDSIDVAVVPDPLPPALGDSVRAQRQGNDVIIGWDDLLDPWPAYEVVMLECPSRRWRVTCPLRPPDPANIQAAPLAGPPVPQGVFQLVHANALDRGDLLFYKVRATSVCARRPGPTCNPWPQQVPPCP